MTFIAGLILGILIGVAIPIIVVVATHRDY